MELFATLTNMHSLKSSSVTSLTAWPLFAKSAWGPMELRVKGFASYVLLAIK